MDTYYIGGVGVAVGVISLLCVMILSIVVWCLWRKMKGEIKNLSESLKPVRVAAIVLASELLGGLLLLNCVCVGLVDELIFFTLLF